jgi:hypothetical protein
VCGTDVVMYEYISRWKDEIASKIMFICTNSSQVSAVYLEIVHFSLAYVAYCKFRCVYFFPVAPDSL